MKLNEFNATMLKNDHCEITFNRPLNEQSDMYDIKLLLEFFGQKQHKKKLLKIDFSKNPLTIKGLVVRHKKHWAMFMEYINLNGREWYSRIRDNPMSVEEGLKILDLLAEANRKEVKMIKDRPRIKSLIDRKE